MECSYLINDELIEINLEVKDKEATIREMEYLIENKENLMIIKDSSRLFLRGNTPTMQWLNLE